MRPVIQRVAQRLRNRRSPGPALLDRRDVPRAIALVNTVGAHRPPLVVIALRPDREQALELAILGDVRRRQMVVIVEDRLRFRVLLIKEARRLALKQEILVEKCHVGTTSLKLWTAS